MEKVKITVSGRVQGVGFRYMTKIVADKLKIKGLVRNLADGSVYMEAVGTKENMALFIKAVKASPSPSGKVENFSMEKDDTLPDYEKFKVVL